MARRGRKDRHGWSEIARDCLAVGTVLKIIWDHDVSAGLSIPLLFALMVLSFFGFARDLIAVLAFLLFLGTFILSFPAHGVILVLFFVTFAVLVVLFRP